MGSGIAVTYVVMAGGRGERLWPLVRSSCPKVCLSLDGRRTLLEETVERLRPVWRDAGWLIVTTREQATAVRACLPRALRRVVLVEPQIKNTAACITLAAVELALREPNRVMVVVPADHWIQGTAVYHQAVRTAIRTAVAYDTLVTIGIRPTHPHPGLGYLCAGEPLEGAQTPRLFWLDRFVEKPSRATARRLVHTPGVYWNSGTFVGTADKFLECITEWLPNHTRRLVPLANRKLSATLSRTASRAYRTLEAISFDQAVMDRLRRGIVVEGRFDWADLGSWETWAKASRVAAEHLSVNSRNVQVVSPVPHLVATIGVHDLVVVHSPTATLICPLEKTQEVRAVVKRLTSQPSHARYL